MRIPLRRLHHSCRVRNLLLLVVYTTIVIAATLYVSSFVRHSHSSLLEGRKARSPLLNSSPHPPHRHSPVLGDRPSPGDNGKEKETIHNRNNAGMHGVGLPSVKRVDG